MPTLPVTRLEEIDSPPTCGPRSQQLCRRGTIFGGTAQRLGVIAFRDRCEHVGDKDPIVSAIIARMDHTFGIADEKRVAAWVGRNRHGLDVGARRDAEPAAEGPVMPAVSAAHDAGLCDMRAPPLARLVFRAGHEEGAFVR